MARPAKRTVDYFPHIATSGKTIFILETNFGNDGYAFWFKLLELLATTDGHVYDCRNSAHWQFLLAKTRVDEVTANKILNLLSDLEAIDDDLWKEKVIWSDNFVENIADVYKNRRNKAPAKPDLKSFYKDKPSDETVSTDDNSFQKSLPDVSTEENTQTKLNKTKLDNTKVESNKETNNDVNAHRFYQQNFGVASAHIIQDLQMWIEDLSEEVVILALTKAIEKNAPYSYAKAIMKNWAVKDIKTVESAEAESLSNAKQKNTFNKPANRKETLPDWATQEPAEKDELVDEDKQKEFEERLARIRAKRKGVANENT
ncbi:DnaD domain protein [Alkalibacterium sp. MB6]|uniref:DnaD domain protein n=1 Tax=Alkalibacterium sp. MB6 TaxID=2081965 RepID=UPI00137B1CD7|nr:DnaD domain protein [Alkalibacterium sp. MB6]